MIFLETDRLYIRNLMEKDVDIMFDYRNNENCSKYQRNQTKDKEALKKLIDERKHGNLSLNESVILALALKDTDEMIGEVVVMPKGSTISFGYTISYKYHRQGFAYEALSKLIDFLHKNHPEYEFICLVDPKNIPSIELLKKLGYIYLGYESEINSQMYGMYVIN